MKKILYIILFLVPLSFLAQTTLKGKVIDDAKFPLPGASIIIKGSTKGEMTNFDGNFTITIPKTPATLVVRFLGYITKEVIITDQTSITIELKPNAEQLDEIVVIGYGSSAKKDLTGAITEVKETASVAAQYNTVGSLLQGRSSGLLVSSNTGSPGAPTSIRIRGANSLRGNNEPLYVIDGVIISSAGEDVINASRNANDSQQTQNGLTGINPRDIESMVVLKDASATAIYGSRGANGVILITTKKGKQGKAVINVFGSSTIINVNNTIPVLNALDYAQYRNESAIINGIDIPYSINGTDVYAIDSAGDPVGDPLRQVNWQDEIFRAGLSKNMGLNISGATEKSNYYLSATFNDTEGILPATFLTNSNLQFNYSNNLTDKLKIDTRVGLYLGRGNMSQGTSISGGSRSFARQLISYNPLVDGEIEDDEDFTNPFKFTENFEEKINEKRLNASVNLTYKINDAFKYQIRAGSNFRTKDRSRWYGAETFQGKENNSLLALSSLEKTSYTFDNLLLYTKRFENSHRLNATVGVTYDGSDSKNEIYEISDFAINNLREQSPQLGGVVVTPFSKLRFKENIFSYLGRFTYTIKNKYMFNASFRADKSSKFQGANQTGYFPAVSLGWTASNEKFLTASKLVSNLKFRASWGQVGNQAINPYQTLNLYDTSLYSDDSGSTVVGVAPLNISNPDLTWETTTQLNAGFDLSLWNGRLSTSFDIYQKETTDLLINTPIPTSSGFTNFLKNQGGLQNQGIDISFDGLIVEKDNFSFSLGGNISFNKSKIQDLEALPASDIWIDGQLVSTPYYLGSNVSSGNNFKAPANAFIQGQEVGLFWGYKTNGIYQDQPAADTGPTHGNTPNLAGDVAYVDVDGDGFITSADRTNIGNPNPDFTYGINAKLKYKNFGLSMLFNGVEGNDIVNGNLLIEGNAEGTTRNIRQDTYLDAWSLANPTGAYPRVGSQSATTRPTDRLVEDGSYFRLNNITLSYDLNLEKESFIQGIRLYASGNNVFTITDYSGYDPELTSFLYNGTIIGVDWGGSPNVSSYVIGANIKF